MAKLIAETKRSFLKKWSMLIGCAIGILGGSSCQDQSKNDDYSVMYGPPINYCISGTVKSSDSNKPIPDIRLAPDKLGSESLSFSDGNYSIILDLDKSNPKDQTITLKVEDIDGSVNGSYAEKSVIVDIKATDYENGYFVKNIDIILDPVK